MKLNRIKNLPVDFDLAMLDLITSKCDEQVAVITRPFPIKISQVEKLHTFRVSVLEAIEASSQLIHH